MTFAFKVLVEEEDYIRDKHNYNHAQATNGPEEFFHFHCLSGVSHRDLEDYFVARRIPKHEVVKHCAGCGGKIPTQPRATLVLSNEADRRARYYKERAKENRYG